MSRKLLAASLLTAASILALVFGTGREQLVYSISVSDFLKRGLWDREVRVNGTLVHGSLCKMEPQCGYRFTLQDRLSWNPDGSPHAPSAQQLRVRYDECVIPDTFRDVPGMDMEVTVEGERCRTCHEFQATRIMARCPAKYQMKGQALHMSAGPIPTCKRPFPSL
ncbi:MAG TPA: cytochrome c maturation protein CcmE [Polyangiaceae bacterium]|nr:cytochrome c maturation protein CcmE [Polyangiaceae bacterium]